VVNDLWESNTTTSWLSGTALNETSFIGCNTACYYYLHNIKQVTFDDDGMHGMWIGTIFGLVATFSVILAAIYCEGRRHGNYQTIANTNNSARRFYGSIVGAS